MIRNDNKLNKRMAKKIIKDYYGKDAIFESMLRINGGKTAAVYKIVSNISDIGILVKVAHIHQRDYLSFEKTMMESEKTISEMLVSQGIQVPPVLKYCPYKSVIRREYKIYDFIESDIPLDWSKIDCDTFEPIIKSLHNIKGAKFGFCSAAKFDFWYDFIVALSEELFAVAIKKKFFVDNSYIEEVRAEIEASKDIFNEIAVPYFVHNDLGRKNFLYKKEDDRYVFHKIIDIEGALFGDIDFEFSRAEITDKDCYNAIMNELKQDSSPNRIKRLRIYSLLNYLISMNIMKGKYNSPQLFNQLKDKYMKRFTDKNIYQW